MIINDETTVRAVRAALAEYEVALTSNDLAGLQRLFIDNELVVRYGPGENLYGAAAIAAFRAARAPGPRPRTVVNTIVTTYGLDTGIAHVEYRMSPDGPLGRQSQTWVRLPQGWRIVAAHVSYLRQG